MNSSESRLFTGTGAREHSEGETESGPLSTEGQDRFLAIKSELKQVMQAIAEDKPLRLKAWKTVADLYGVPVLKKQTTFNSQNEEQTSLNNRILAHLAKLPMSMGVLAYGRVCMSILQSVFWFCVASEGRWDRSWQLMVRRDA